jgi:tetratricopeptide (TPR) repeat protein
MGLMLSREIGDEAAQAYMLYNLGLVMCDQGDPAMAERLLSEGLAITQAQSDKYLASAFHGSLGAVSLQRGQFERAIQCANVALAMRRELALHLRAADDLSTSALAHLALGNHSEALDCAQQALSILNECRGEGPEFPQRDYFICYQVLQGNGLIEAARDALQSAYRLVMARADKIADPALRQSFLGSVPINRDIGQAAAKVL